VGADILIPQTLEEDNIVVPLQQLPDVANHGVKQAASPPGRAAVDANAVGRDQDRLSSAHLSNAAVGVGSGEQYRPGKAAGVARVGGAQHHYVRKL